MSPPQHVDPALVEQLAEVLTAARRVLFVTGAGVSADSGLPTYRGVGGLYDSGTTDEGVPIEVALSGEMLTARPEVCWKYMLQIERACRGAAPNRAHEVIASIQRRREGAWLLTQNVDGLHARAGSEPMIEIHGNLQSLSCTACAWRARVDDFLALEPQLGTPAAPTTPRCPACGEMIRPQVVLFGEMLPQAAIASLQRELQTGFDAVVSVGTTSAFPYIAAPVVMAKRAGAPTVEINPGETDVSSIVDLRIRSTAATTFSALAQMMGL
ncbi:MAG: SIR2 family NAD-dependent protein deacylase [Nannocystaceae bacterium]|nr:NAD-dependent protein deacylase [bacterium]